MFYTVVTNTAARAYTAGQFESFAKVREFFAFGGSGKKFAHPQTNDAVKSIVIIGSDGATATLDPNGEAGHPAARNQIQVWYACEKLEFDAAMVRTQALILHLPGCRCIHCSRI